MRARCYQSVLGHTNLLVNCSPSRCVFQTCLQITANTRSEQYQLHFVNIYTLEHRSHKFVTRHLRIRILGKDVVEALRLDDVSDRQSISVERLIQGSRSIGVLNIRTVNGRVNKRHDATQSLSCGQRGVAAKGGHILSRRVEVLLSLDKGLGGVNDSIIITKLVDNVIGKRELGSTRRMVSVGHLQ